VQPPPSQQQLKEDLSKALTSFADLLPHLYREQSKRLLTSLAVLKKKTYQLHDKKSEFISQSKSYNLVDSLSDLFANGKRLE